MLFRGIKKIFEIIYNEAEKELYDETPYKEALDEIYELFDSGKITEDEYEAEETVILEKLMEIKKYKKEHEMREE